MKIKLFFSAIMISLQALAQEPTIQWQKTFGGSKDDFANSIRQTTDGGFIVAGSSASSDGDVTGNHGKNDCWIIKLDVSGSLVWQKSLGGSADDYANSIQQTTDGGYVIAGYSSSVDGDVTANHGGKDYWIIKLDASGNLVWQKSLGGSADDYASSIQQTTDGGYIVAGSSVSNDGDVSGNHGDSDFWIVKLDASGNLIWQKSIGGATTDNANNIQQTTDGGYIVVGASMDSNFYAEFYGVIYRLDANGSEVWTSKVSYMANSIQQTTDGSFIVTGQDTNILFLPPDGSQHGCAPFVSKLGANGNFIWKETLGDNYSHSEEITYSIRQTIDGGYILAGYIKHAWGVSYYRIYKLDASGNLVWKKDGTNMDSIATDIQQTTDGGYIISGTNYDFMIIKLDTEALSAPEFELEKHSVIYPNPTQNIINIKADENYKSISILDVSGKELFQTNEKKENLSLSNYDRGIYFLTIQFDNGNTETHKIIKE